ncbi:hypothetical protein [Uliginosibacterium sp. H1]|uniref:hypothetical protein n=1 Tax=Uliginosibacterium sp. H1 TaxID=3114757 RepID=UPI002E18A471|nr:hypothetical protein [Uliginosibacterium sp. H1]
MDMQYLPLAAENDEDIPVEPGTVDDAPTETENDLEPPRIIVREPESPRALAC